MRTSAILLGLGICAVAAGCANEQSAREAVARADANIAPATVRPPAVPLIAHTPYFSVWSCADRLTDDVTRHWTRREQSLVGLVRVDEKTYRVMGKDPAETPAMEQVGVQVLPTRTIYKFKSDALILKLTFMTPALPDDLDVLARPVTYVIWDAQSVDGKKHDVQVYLSAAGTLAVNDATQKVSWASEKLGSIKAVRLGSVDQPILQKKGDDLRIDWGYLYLAGMGDNVKLAAGSAAACQKAFADRGEAPAEDARMPRAANDDSPVLAAAVAMGQVGAATVSRHVMLAYDEIYSINYFGEHLRPYWRKAGLDAAGLLAAAARDYPSLMVRCAEFDRDLMADLVKAGGQKYAEICALAYRQCLAANVVAADANGQPLMFSKENFSNGCIATVDVFYPMMPQLLLTSPILAKASVVPVLEYAKSERWRWPFAPHDLGTYPHATGQVYGGGERTEENQMPVEESGNMILLVAAIAKIDGNMEFANRYWGLMTKWVEYLEEKGFDPENQLCTDDFAGHLAHNANLSIKAIQAIASYGMMCQMRGDKANAEKYLGMAKEMAEKWMKAADDGDHYRLAFDKPGTWSQKYNLVWDTVLGLNVFPKEVAQKEMAYYRKVMKPYGLPLDNRQPYTKTDWEVWTATLADNDQDFQMIIGGIYEFLNKSPSRVPFTDWYFTHDAKQVGFQARPVIGGVFMKMLADEPIWKKWAKRDTTKTGMWSEIPEPPEINEIVPSSRRRAQTWQYTTANPGEGWFKADFDDKGWQQGRGGFGTRETPGAAVRTVWNSPDIWIRREFNLSSTSFKDLKLYVHHDEDAEIYVNGVLAAKCAGYVSEYGPVAMSAEARAALRAGTNVMAVHCHQTGGGQYIDVGFVETVPATRQPMSINIDASKTRQPISKYVYGQFIEHLGRCIYGGIWAEMIEDRKFFYPVGANESPWRAMGGAEVTMVKENPFVGAHTPKIVLDGKAGGIVQEGLGIVAGKEYTGRIWLAGSGQLDAVNVSLVWGTGPKDRDTVKFLNAGQAFAKVPLKFKAGATTDSASLEISCSGKGGLSVGTVSLMPADNVAGMRADTLALLKELDSPVYRWPGGNFVSGYDWKDGIGDPDRRPPRKNPAWRGVEHNDFGLDEFMVFCKVLGTEPYIAVNSGLGDAKSAVEEVEYANGAANTPGGALRAKNGRTEPYKVKFWSIGNEMYGDWQLGHMPLEKYQEKHNEFARAMRKVDATITLIGVGSVGPWSEGMMKNCADYMELISEHFYCQERPTLRAHVRQIPDNVKRIADAHRKYRMDYENLKGKDIQIALDEWNYWYGPHIFGELGTRYFLKDGLGIAAGLHEYFRNSDIMYMANYAQTVNVIGAIKTNKTAAAFETTGLVLALYRQHFGTIPVAAEAVSNGSLDVAAAWSDDRKTLTVGVVNATLKEQQIPLKVAGAALTGNGQKWQIAGSDPMAYNDPARPTKIVIEERTVKGISDTLTVAPCSVTVFALKVK